MKKLMLAVASCLIWGCSGSVDEPEPPPPTPPYAFFAAGHAYGYPYLEDRRLHPPLTEKSHYISDQENMAFGFLLGDTVQFGTAEEYDEVDNFATSLGIKVYLLRGNHESNNLPLFTDRYGPTWFEFTHRDDLFLVLDPNQDHWNISGDQLAFVSNALANHTDARRIFVMFHQVLWWAPDNIYAGFRINSNAGRAENINFFSELEPLFRQFGGPVYMFAGDVGAFATGHEFMYHHYENIYLIATGMGGGERDNLVIAEVTDNGVDLRLVALNGDDPDALGQLQDYVLPPLPSKSQKLFFTGD